MGKSTFGEHLKREREMRGVSLQEISSATRISTRFLEALENEHWDRLPGGVFNRGFVRAVARFLGLDEESLVAEYALATNDRPEVAVWVVDRPVTKPRRQQGRWAAALLAAVVAAGAGWVAYEQNRSLLESLRQPVPAVPAPKPPQAPQITRTPKAAEATRRQTERAAAASPALQLKIDAGRETTLTVVADGIVVFDGTIGLREQRRFQATDRFEISAGNSSALLLELNGLTLPPLGPPNQPGRATFTREELKKLRGG